MSMASSPSPDKILAWYFNVKANFVDIVGDYAGQELFLIDGDSLLLECFKDRALDFDAGFQILHAVFITERFLQNLARRGCRFHVAFFDTNTHACIPPEKASPHKYLFTRQLIIQHLESNAHDLRLLQFQSPNDTEFQDYVKKAKVYFVACSDGASYRGANAKATTLAKEDIVQGSQRMSYHRAFLRQNIRHYMKNGLDVALLNGMEFRDSKVFCFVVAGSKKAQDFVASPFLALGDSSISNHYHSSEDSPSASSMDYDRLLSALDTVTANLELPKRSSRLLITALALQRMPISARHKAFTKACLVHTALLELLSLAERNFLLQSFEPNDEIDLECSLRHFCQASSETLSSQTLTIFSVMKLSFTPDYLDGRLLRHVWNMLKYGNKKDHAFSLEEIVNKLSPLISFGNDGNTEAGFDFLEDSRQPLPDLPPANAVIPLAEKSILPFSHPAFDKHLSSIHIVIEINNHGETSEGQRNLFDLNHWHNSKKSIIPRKGYSDEQHRDTWWLKRHQRFLRDLSAYAASLTNANGKILAPERIFVELPVEKRSDQASHRAHGKQITKERKDTGKQKANKSALSNKNAIIASNIEERTKKQNKVVLDRWARKRNDLDKITGPIDRFIKTSAYETEFAERKDIDVVSNELLLYRLAALLQIWKAYCHRSDKAHGYHVAAIALDLLHRLSETSVEVPREAPGLVNDISRRLGLPVPGLATTGERPLSFPFSIGDSSNIGIEMEPIKFRLLHGGPYMDRSMGSQKDDRVPFQPDAWQKEVLDELDKQTSLLLVVPTGGGKTFISFYAMEKVLRANDDDVVVYVAPTKALVNQVAAEITARFTKDYKHPGKALCGIHTRDIRVHNPTQCQVLVTVPHILQIMLLSPSNKDWVPRVKTIIFDEVHSISASEDGVIWEQLLMMAPCQIIALSATVGNPEAFTLWLQSIQEAKGSRFRAIQHEHRFSDLRKYTFQSSSGKQFQGLTGAPALSPLGLEGNETFDFLHPISSLTSSARGIPADLALESRDCFFLFDVIKKCETKEFPVPNQLAPGSNFAPDSITKAEVIRWAQKLKDFLATWMSKTDSPFQTVVTELSKASSKSLSDGKEPARSPSFDQYHAKPPSDVTNTTLSLLQNLHKANALPAILFNFARGRCEEIAINVFDRLLEAENFWKANNRSWQNKLAAFAQWQDRREAAAKQAMKGKKKAGNNDKDQHDSASGKLSKAERERESLESRDDAFEGFDPDDPLEAFSFANPKKADRNEIDALLDHLRFKRVNESLVSAFKRGIAAHHSGLNKAYRQAVEVWFRRGYLTAVVATGTLALGINMPCKTVVFTEDSVFLTTLNYRQASGRAGRRGFDLLGNVVFYGISKEKARRLMSSRIPALIGHFPVTTSLVLRLLILLHNTNNAPYAMKMVDSLLSQPRLYLGGESFRHQVLHHLRFSIEYLRRQGLIAKNGAPINFASSVAHLYYVEQSAFGFHALLRGGYFSTLADEMHSNEEETLRTLMLVMSHLFFRCPMRQVEKESEDSELIRKSPSVVFLPPLPKAAARVMRKHNEETLDTYTTYVRTFVNQHCKDLDDILPFTGLKIGNQSTTISNHTNALSSDSPPVQLRSPFVALSGHTDDFSSISSLCDTVRSGVFLEKVVVPHLEISDGISNPLNAALYDFYQHGAVKPLVEANKVRSGDVWFLLNDFSMVLATLISSLEGFMASGGSNYDGDLEDVVGGLAEALEIEREGEVDSQEAHEKNQEADRGKTTMGTGPPASTKQKSKDVLESWEDEDEDADPVDFPSPRAQKPGRTWNSSGNATRTPSPIKSSHISETPTTSSTGYTSESEGKGDQYSPAAKARVTEAKLRRVLHMFKRLRENFDVKFRRIFA